MSTISAIMVCGHIDLGRYDYFATLADRKGVMYCHNPALNSSQCTRPNLQEHVTMNDTFAVAPLRDLARGYAAAISMVDEQFGKVVATLDHELALAEQTVVVFMVFRESPLAALALAISGLLGAVWGRSWASLGPTWAALGRLGALLGPSGQPF